MTERRCASGLRRRRRRLHRQPLRRRAARRPGHRAGHRLRQLLLRAATGTSSRSRRTTRGSRVVEGDVGDLDALHRRDAGPRHGHPPGLQPRHRRRDDRTRRSTSTRARCSPTTSSRRCGAAGVALVLYASRQRGLRRPRRARGRRGPRPAGARRRPTAPASSPARRCWRRTPRCSTSPAARSASATSSARSQTHGVGFDFVRRLLEDPTRLRILGDGTQSKSYIHVERRRRRGAAGRRRRPTTPFDGVQRRDRRLHHRHRDRRARHGGARPRARLDRRSSTPAATAAGRATCPSSGSRPTGSGRSAGRTSAPGREALRDSMPPMADEARRGAALTALSPAPARRLPRPGRRAQRGRRRRRRARPAARRVAEFELLPGRGRGLPRPSRTPGCALVVVTNQPDIARGTLRPGRASTRSTRGCARELPLDDVVVCPHDDADGCGCRKPRPGMILDAARRLGLDLDRQRRASATAGATSRRPSGPAWPSVWIDWGLRRAAPGLAGPRSGSLALARDHVRRSAAHDGSR